MRWLLSAGLKISRFLYVISGIGLVVMMLLTVLDVALRMVGRPITGAYELVAYGVVLVVSLLFLPAGLCSLPARIEEWRKERRI